jgi:phosphatidylglycerophosphate synthase
MPRRIIRQLPNLLSASRLVFAAGFVAADGAGTRLGLLGLAGLTDVLDGFLARRVNAATRWGALVDPITDRFFALAAVATLLFEGLLSVPHYFILITRDLATAVGFLVARTMPSLRPATFKARWSGKAVTVLQFAAVACALAWPAALAVLMPLVLIVSVVSIADYTRALWHARRAA